MLVRISPIVNKVNTKKKKNTLFSVLVHISWYFLTSLPCLCNSSWTYQKQTVGLKPVRRHLLQARSPLPSISACYCFKNPVTTGNNSNSS